MYLRKTMRKFGFKIYSTNLYTAPNLIKACADYVSSVADAFIELMVGPSSSMADLKKIKRQIGNIEVRVHAPHDSMGFNPADKELEQQNRNLLALSQKAADLFKSKTIVVHAGLGHGQKYIDETVRQFRLFCDSRIVVENLPYLDYGTVPMHGSTAEDISYIMQETGCGFCFDFSHAVCSAISLNVDIDEHLKNFFELHPTVYHMCDGDTTQSNDLHLHFRKGNFPLPHFLNDFTVKDAYITMETSMHVEQDISLKIEDYLYLKSVQNI